MNVKNASTVAGVTAAFTSVSAMKGFNFQTTLTAQQKLDLAAYIASR